MQEEPKRTIRILLESGKNVHSCLCCTNFLTLIFLCLPFPKNQEMRIKSFFADIAEQKKLAMEDLDKNNDVEKSKSHLLHSASFYSYSGTGPICPKTPSKKAEEEKKEEEVENGGWAGW